MTDVFRSEILAVVMQQIVDEPVLPVLFLRTVLPLRRLGVVNTDVSDLFLVGHPGCNDIQVIGWIRIYDSPFQVDN